MKPKTITDFLNVRATSKFIFSISLVAMADFLFYGEKIGWTLGFFTFLLTTVTFIHNFKAIVLNRQTLLPCAFSFVMSLALINATGFGTTCLAAITLFGFTIAVRNPKIDDLRKIFVAALAAPLCGIWHSFSLAFHFLNRRLRLFRGRGMAIRYWVLPCLFLIAFIFLFAQANPVLYLWLSNINWPSLEDIFSPRILFWFVVGALCFAIIRPRLNLRKKRFASPFENHAASASTFFNERSTIATLILFNVMFAAQNCMDVAVIWGGAGLPAGVSYAQYAHDGAYPLIFTAMLAALFVLIALRPGTAMERSRAIRGLVFAWVAQNVLLTNSAIVRLIGYVGEYSLTYLRVWALIWTGLVAIGLVLIVARIYCNKNNFWLVNANCLMLYTVLVLCCFFNFGRIIAEYNVHHCREITGTGSSLDEEYLDSIGNEALPAKHWYYEHAQHGVVWNKEYFNGTLLSLQPENHNWREWTFRNYLLIHDLKACLNQTCGQ